MKTTATLLLATTALAALLPAQQEVPVTIKELDVREAIAEFQQFQQRLEAYRAEVAEGQSAATEMAQILAELQSTATAENNFNETEILTAIESYIENAVVSQVELVDFLESQRYRIAYYANKMANSVSPQDVAVLFGTEADNVVAIEFRVQEVTGTQAELADFLDALPEDQFDKRGFRALPGMSLANQRKLNQLQLRYQNQRNALELAKSRLSLVRQANRLARDQGAVAADLNVDLLLGQMFGALDRIRLQMSADLLHLEAYLSRFTQTSQTQEIFGAFQRLLEAQGGLDAPSPGLANILDWLQTSSSRHVSLGAQSLDRSSGGLGLHRSSDLLREAYLGARGNEANQ